MEMDQAQRRDIDGLISSHVSLVIDEERGLESPYHYTLSDIVEGNNWVIDDGFVKQSLVAEDRIIFNLPAFDVLEQKNITKVELHLTGSSDFAILKTVTLSNGSVENGLEFDEVFEEDMLLDCGLFGFDNLNDVFNAESILTIGLDGNNNQFRLSSAELYIYHEDVLQEEIDVVKNRLDSEGFQEKLISGTNIKTINQQSLLGSGNINISGGGSILGVGAFSINEEGHLIVELPDYWDNPYYIDNNGHLIYDTSNAHNGGLIE